LTIRLLAALFGLFLIASPVLIVFDSPAMVAEGGSLPSWNRSFHLHDGTVQSAGIYDWLNSSGPVNPTWTDYDGDGLPGITIKKNVPPQRYHEWILYPPSDSAIVLTGSFVAHLWVKSQGNDSGTIVNVMFYDVTPSQFSDPFLGTLIAQGNSNLVGPFYSEFQMVNVTTPSVSYALPVGHYLSLVVQRGDSLNDWLIVWYDRTIYDSYVALTTTNFISVSEVHSEDVSGIQRVIFSDLEDVIVAANVSDPFGSYDIYGANVTVAYQSNRTNITSMLPMVLTDWDRSAIPYWKVLKATLPKYTNGSYIANVSAYDSDGYPTWLEMTFTIVTVDHFNVTCPARVVAGVPFSTTVTALNQYNTTVTDWVGTVQLEAYRTDKVTPRMGTLTVTSIQFNPSDLGVVTITDERCMFGEELIYVRASAGPRIGWSDLITVASGPVVNVTILPSANMSVAAGASPAFSVVGNDTYGNTNNSWNPYWTVSGGIGSVTANGMTATFYATTLGQGNLTCTNNQTGAAANVSITVISGALARINITSATYPLYIHENETVSLAATGYDSSGNIVSIADANWTTTTSGAVDGHGPSAVYQAGLVPETGAIKVLSGSVIGTLDVVVLNGLTGPWLNQIPAQIRNEDTGTWALSLTGYWQDVDGTSTLFWWVEGVNNSLYFISHDPSHNSVMQFYTQPDQFGEDEFTLWVMDPDGFRTFQIIQVRIIPVNDAPQFVNDVPTELYVKFAVAYTFDYTYFVDDVDNTEEELRMTSTAPKMTEGFLWNISFDGLIGTFLFNRKDGDTSYFEIVTIKVYDPAFGFDEERIIVKVTKDSPPDLNTTLPDIYIDEGQVMLYGFDLDDYFYDLDGDPLYYTTGFENIPNPYIEPGTHKVYFSAPGEWSGVTSGTFIANDTIGALKVDTIKVFVRAVNDPPQVGDIEDIQVKHDLPYYLYLSPYVYDPDNSLDSLTFDISSKNVTKGTSATGADRLEILFPANLSGLTVPYRVTVWMNVSDSQPLTASTHFDVLVTDNIPPTVIAEKPDQLYYTFPEDTYLNESLMLYDIFRDYDDEFLNFTIESSGSYVQFIILPNGDVSLTAAKDWNGVETFNITARDSHGAWASVQAYVIVTPVNDPPVAIVVHEKLLKSGNSRNVVFEIDRLVYFYDPDNEELRIIASPEANAVVVGNYLYITLPSGVDVITVTLQASDGELSSNIVSVKVGVQRTIAQKIGYPYTLPLVLLAAGIAGYFIGARLPRPYALENLFLIHNDGRLVAHVTREENTLLDKDVVSAMFTAVQEFVRDSFQKGEVGLKKLEIGEKNVLIEKGRSAYLALIYSGWPQKETFDMLPVLLRDIEERYKDRLGHWNGTVKTVDGVEKMLQEYMASAFKPGSWHEEEEIAEEEWVDILDKEA